MENTRKRASEQTSRIDYAVILPVFILCIIGLTSLYVALSQDPAKPNVVRGVGLQTLWYILGIGAIAIIMHIKVKLLWKLTPLIYGGGLLVMALLLQFYDRSIAEVTGSKNWFSIGSFTLQPAELMKIAYILMLALVVTKHNGQHRTRTLRTDGQLIAKMLAVTDRKSVV